MKYFLCIVIAVLSLAFVFMCLYMNKLLREKDKQIQEEQDVQKQKNEQKESMETGDNRTDFDTSLNLLHDLANRK